MDSTAVGAASLLVGIASSGATMFVGWLLRRDSSNKDAAVESARVAEVDRRLGAFGDGLAKYREVMEDRVHSLETSRITERDFENFTRRLNDIQSDLREIRSFQINFLLRTSGTEGHKG